MIGIIVIEEILIANGLTVLMMWFLLLCRRKNRESLHEEDKLYDGMAIVNLAGALSETIAFLVDGNQFTGLYLQQHMFYRYRQHRSALVSVCRITHLPEL